MLSAPSNVGPRDMHPRGAGEYSPLRWWVLTAILVAAGVGAMIMISVAPMMGVIAKSLDVNIGTASVGLMGLFALAAAFGCAIAGVLFDRFGVFEVLIASIVLMGVPHATLPWLGHSYWAIVLVRVLEGLAFAPALVAIGPVAAQWFPPEEIGIANALNAISISMGIMVGLVVSPILVRMTGSWQTGVAWVSILCGVGLLVALGAYGAVRRHSPASVKEETGNSVHDAHLYRQALRNPVFWAGQLCIAAGVWTQNAFNDLTPGFLAVAPPVGVGLGPAVAGKTMTTVMIAGVVGALLGGTLIDQVFRGKCRPVILMGFALIAVFCYLLKFPVVHDTRPYLLASLAMVGIGSPFINASILGFAAKTFPTSIVGKVVGQWMSVSLFAGAIGVMAGGTALRSTGTYQLSLSLVSFVALVGVIATPSLRARPLADGPLENPLKTSSLGVNQES